MINYLLPLLAFTSTLANPLPQTPTPVAATRTAVAVSSYLSAASAVPTVPFGSIPFGVRYNDTEGGKRIHPYMRQDLCIQVVNDTLFAGAVVGVGRCLNNTAPLPAQRNLFNLTTLNVTANYTGLIAPANQTELCLSGLWHIPDNATDYATRADRLVTLQNCDASDVHQVWRYGIDERVTNGTTKAYKLSLDDQKHCATMLRNSARGGVTSLVFGMYPCVRNAGSQLLMVYNGTDTPTGRIPGIPLIP